MMIDSYVEGWLEQLLEQAASLRPNQHLHILLDSAFLPGIHRSVPTHAAGDQAPRLLFESLPSCDPDTQDVSPLLLQVDPSTLAGQGFQRWLSQCNGYPMVHAITTHESLSELGQRLERWCVVNADGQRFNFRFPDTRRINGIFERLNHSQRAHFVGPAISWRYIGRNGRWQTLSDLPLQAATEPLDTRLTAAQFAALLNDSDTDGILTILDDRGYPWTHQHSVNHATVAQALEVFADLVEDEPTKVDWCEACLSDAQLLQAGRPVENLQRWLARNAV